MPQNWQPRVVLITGASSGIGRATALELIKRDVAVIARRSEALAELAAMAPNQITPIVLDITDSTAIVQLATHLAEIGLLPDVLINNAGYAHVGPVENVELADVRQQFETNFIGAIAMIQTFLPHMRNGRRGRIVNISSVAGIISLPFAGIYSASKFALEAVSDALRLEVASFDIDVVLVEPAAHCQRIFCRIAQPCACIRIPHNGL
jgi:NAD(P)-dependent dehydrogenase (short-subunit alcohol dehydrogenase family)